MLMSFVFSQSVRNELPPAVSHLPYLAGVTDPCAILLQAGDNEQPPNGQSLLMQLNEWVSSAALCFLSCCGITSNLLLFLAVFKKSTGVMRKYTVLLFNFIFTDLTACFLTLFILPQYFFHNGKMFFIARGSCSYLGEQICFVTYSMLICLFSHVTWLLLASILFRWYILRNRDLTNNQLLCFLFVVFSPTCLQLFCTVSVAFSNIGHSHQTPEWHNSTIAESLEGQTVFGARMREGRVAIVDILIIVPIFPILITGVLLRNNIMKSLETFDVISENGKKVKKSFYRSLSVQLLLLPIHLTAVLIFVCDRYNLTVSSGQIPYVLVHHIPFLNAICQLYYVAPYRKYMNELLGLAAKSSSPATREQIELKRM